MEKSDVVKMLPLIRSYCRDLSMYFHECKRLMKIRMWLINKKTTNKERTSKKSTILQKIGQKLSILSRNFTRWKMEIQDMGGIVCCPENGLIDFPIEDFALGTRSVCVEQNSDEENLKWHFSETPNVRV